RARLAGRVARPRGRPGWPVVAGGGRAVPARRAVFVDGTGYRPGWYWLGAQGRVPLPQRRTARRGGGAAARGRARGRPTVCRLRDRVSAGVADRAVPAWHPPGPGPSRARAGSDRGRAAAPAMGAATGVLPVPPAHPDVRGVG